MILRLRRLLLGLLSIVAVFGGAGVASPSSDAQEPPAAQTLDGRDGRELLLRSFRPRPMLVVPQHALERARFPVVDVHWHPRFRWRGSAEALDAYVALMDRNGVAVCVSLDGGLGADLEEHREYLWKKHRDRFVFFANIDWRGDGRPDEPATWDCQRPDFPRRVAAALADAKESGASGLKLFKQFGLEFKNPDESLIAVDDPRWDPIWRACGELGLPVIMHTADPAAFFLPIDAANERWEELSRRPEWSYQHLGPDFRRSLHEARNRVIGRHRRTTFIAAHLANDGEDLAMLAAWLDDHPNLVVEIASRIAELGRQPYTARQFLVKYADRVLFGTDGPWPEERLRLYWRFLESFDENFPYSEKEFPPQGFWNIYGVGLPDETLRKIYHENAARIIPGVAERLERHGR